MRAVVTIVTPTALQPHGSTITVGPHDSVRTIYDEIEQFVNGRACVVELYNDNNHQEPILIEHMHERRNRVA